MSWYFDGAAGETKKDVWKWWAERRFRYNRDLFVVGFTAWWVVWIAGAEAVNPGVDFVEPFAMIFGPPIYGFCANVAYTAGPVVDTYFWRGRPRKYLLRAGYVFSVLLTSMPGVWAVVAWLWTRHTGVKLG